MRFWDREREIKELKAFIESEPNSILFVYGPKSSGKSTLVEKVIEEIKEEKKGLFFDKYQIYWFDLRGKFIPNYESVVDMFFLDEETEFAKEISKDMEIGVMNFFKVKRAVKEEFKQKRTDPFEYMEGMIRKAKKKTVIVFDEIQRLKSVYLNSPSNQRQVIDELFNFFVRLTKVKHLSHVFVMTSDTFFIEQIYQSSSLENTSRYYLVDFFDDDTAMRILMEEGLSKNEAEYAVSWIGGVPWMMKELVERVRMEDLRNVIVELFKTTKSSIDEKLDTILVNDGERAFKFAVEILRKIVRGDEIGRTEENRRIMRKLVELEILYYDPVNKRLIPHTRLHEKAIRELLEAGAT